MGHDLSVAGGVGFIALAGVAAEFGVMMVMYLKQALDKRVASGVAITPAVVDDAIREGAVMRVRPKAITVFTLLVGLAPVVFGSGTGSELMSRIAAPMLGGMITAPLLSLFIVPAVYALMRRGQTGRPGEGGAALDAPARAGTLQS
jgi:Cu(I)/Ag(I) efflux system membrane protein CusA/SilA